MLPLQKKKLYQKEKNGICATFRIGQDIQCLPYAGFLFKQFSFCQKFSLGYFFFKQEKIGPNTFLSTNLELNIFFAHIFFVVNNI